MQNITFSADDDLIEAGHQRAQAGNSTLNEQFRLWLESYVGREQQAKGAAFTMNELQGKLRVGRKPTREDANER